MRKRRLSFTRWAAGITLGGLLLVSGAPTTAQEEMGFPDLLAGLEATPGCIGVESGQMRSGKQVIFAWFENKEAAMKWYYSDMHQGVLQKFFPAAHGSSGGHGSHAPMAGVADGIPIMVIASITMADESQFAETQLPISQISIELYTPVTGGLFLGSRFAPEGLQVKNMRDVTPGR